MLAPPPRQQHCQKEIPMGTWGYSASGNEGFVQRNDGHMDLKLSAFRHPFSII